MIADEADCDAPDDEHLFRAAAPPSSSQTSPGSNGQLASTGLPVGRQSGSLGFLHCHGGRASVKDEIKPADFDTSPVIPGWTDGWTGIPSSSSTARVGSREVAVERSRLQQSRQVADATRGRQVPTGLASAFTCDERLPGGAAAAAAEPSGGQAPAKKPEKCRTLKYFPPPQDDHDPVAVDVIDHGSEVLIVRRDPSPLRAAGCQTTLLGTGGGGSSRPPQQLGGRSPVPAKIHAAKAVAAPPGGGALWSPVQKDVDASL